jgi:hypothetical protein
MQPRKLTGLKLRRDLQDRNHIIYENSINGRKEVPLKGTLSL